jgi:hypothetical protein
VADVKVALFPTGYTDTNDDALIQAYIDAVTGEVAEYTGRQFVTVPSTDYYFDIARPSRSIYVPAGVQSVTTLGFATASQPATGGSYTTITAAHVLIRPLAADRRSGFPGDVIVVSDLNTQLSAFTVGYNTVKANMTCGFAAVPAEIERLAVALVVDRFQTRKGSNTGTLGPADFGGPFTGRMGAEEKMLLDRYSDVSVG